MVDLKKILRRAFWKTSLENEDWLDPSDDMLAQIEGRIYAKKRGRAWLFLLPALLLLLVMGGLWFSINSTDTQQMGHQISNTVPQVETLPSEAMVSENNFEAEEYNTPILPSNEKSLTAQIVEDNPIISVENNIINTKATSTKKPPNTTKNKVATQSDFLTSESIFTQKTSKLKLQNASEESVVQLENNSFAETKEGILVANPSVRLDALENAALLPVSGKVMARAAPPIKVILPKKSTWSLVAGTGISFWQFKLNDAYRTALAPADFQSSNGVGLRTYVGVDKKMGSRFSLGTTLAYERINFTSGHNSNLGYNRGEETDTDHSNTKMVRMATPVGFVESDLVINRESDLADTEVLIDIKNRHQIQSLDLQLRLGYEFPQILGLTPTVNVGAGVNYILKVTNELNSFTPRKTDFSAGKGEIVADQSSLQSWSPTVTTGFGLEKNVTKNLSVGVNGGYLFNLNALQEVDGFSTRVNRFNGGIYLRRNF